MEVEKLARQLFKELVLKLVSEGLDDVQDILAYFKNYGIEVPQSTAYSALKELEREGLLVSKGVRNKKYELTEEGRKFLESKRRELERLESSMNKLKIFNTVGVKDLLRAIGELFGIVEKLTPEERAELAVALGAATTAVRKALAKHI